MFILKFHSLEMTVKSCTSCFNYFQFLGGHIRPQKCVTNFKPVQLKYLGCLLLMRIRNWPTYGEQLKKQVVKFAPNLGGRIWPQKCVTNFKPVQFKSLGCLLLMTIRNWPQYGEQFMMWALQACWFSCLFWMLAEYTICTIIQITLPVLGVERCFDHHFVGNFVCYWLSIIAHMD